MIIRGLNLIHRLTKIIWFHLMRFHFLYHHNIMPKGENIKIRIIFKYDNIV